MRLAEYFIEIGNLKSAGIDQTIVQALSQLAGVVSVKRVGRSLVLVVHIKPKSVGKQALLQAVLQAGGLAIRFVRAEDEGLIEYDRVFAATLVLMVLLYISAGSYQTLWQPWLVSSIPQPYGFMSVVIGMTAIIWMLITPLWLFGLRELVYGRPNFCSVVSLAAGVFTLYSLYLVGWSVQTQQMVFERLYFDVAGFFLVGAGWILQIDRKTKGITIKHLHETLSRSLQQKVWIESEEAEPQQVVSLAVNVGDQVVFASRQILCADGVLVGKKEANVDEYVLSGQHTNILKRPGDKLYAGSRVRSTRLVMQVTDDSENTLLKRLGNNFGGEYRESQHLQKQLESPLGGFMWLALFVSLVTGGVFFFNNQSWSSAFLMSLRIYPFLLPVVAIAALPLVRRESVERALRLGFLLKGDEVLDTIARLNTIIINKEGIVTDDTFEQPTFFCYEEDNRKLYTDIMLTMMKISNHRTVELFYQHTQTDNNWQELDKVTILEKTAENVRASYAGQEYQLTDRRHLLNLGFVEDVLNQQADEYELEGKMCLYLVKNSFIVGLLVFKETINSESVRALAALQKMGLNVVLFTSISQKSANALGREIGVLHIYANLRAEERMLKVKEMQSSEGGVVYVSVQAEDTAICRQSDVAITQVMGGKELLSCVDATVVGSVLSEVVRLYQFSQLYVRSAVQTSRITYISIVLFLPFMLPLFIKSKDSFLHSEHIMMLFLFTLMLSWISSARIKMFKKANSRTTKDNGEYDATSREKSL